VPATAFSGIVWELKALADLGLGVEGRTLVALLGILFVHGAVVLPRVLTAQEKQLKRRAKLLKCVLGVVCVGLSL
jgi:hypothetical protein